MIGIALLVVIVVGVVVVIVALAWAGRRRLTVNPMMRPQSVLIGLAVVAAVVPGVRLLIAPSYSSGRTLLEVDGPSALVPLIVPIVLTLLPALARRPEARTLTCAALGTFLGVLSFIAGFSIGLFYVPAAAFLVTAGGLGLAGSRTA